MQLGYGGGGVGFCGNLGHPVNAASSTDSTPNKQKLFNRFCFIVVSIANVVSLY